MTLREGLCHCKEKFYLHKYVKPDGSSDFAVVCPRCDDYTAWENYDQAGNHHHVQEIVAEYEKTLAALRENRKKGKT